MPLGQSLVIPEGWEITVLDFIPDATQAVLDENLFNDPPDAGFRYVIITLRATNASASAGATTEAFDASFVLRLVRPRTDAPSLNVEIDQFTRGCGIIPNEFPFDFEESAQVSQGGIVEGNVCFHVGADETGFVMLADFLGEDRDQRYFALE